GERRLEARAEHEVQLGYLERTCVAPAPRVLRLDHLCLFTEQHAYLRSATRLRGGGDRSSAGATKERDACVGRSQRCRRRRNGYARAARARPIYFPNQSAAAPEGPIHSTS